MRYIEFCKKFYNDGKQGPLISYRSKGAIARFFLESALTGNHQCILPTTNDACTKWYDRNGGPKAEVWKNVVEDIDEMRFSSAISSQLDDSWVEEMMNRFKFQPSLSSYLNSISEKNQFTRALTKQFIAIASGDGVAPDIMGVRPVFNAELASADSAYYKPYFEAIAERLSTINTVFRDERFNFKDCYVPTGLIDVGNGEYEDESLDLFDPEIDKPTISNIIRITKRLVVQATGGMGKSMLMRSLLFDGIENASNTGMIPVFIWLRDYNWLNYDVMQFFFDEFASYFPGADKERFQQDLADGKIVLLLDGLDEIASVYRGQFLKNLLRFCSIYRKAPVIISSRPLSSEVSLGNFKLMTLKALSKEQALLLVSKIISASNIPKRLERFYHDLDTTLYETHHIFARNPLLLVFMMFTYDSIGELPKQRYKFYEDVYYVLARRHDRSKDDFERPFKSGLTAERLHAIFAAFCANTYQDDMTEFSYQELADEFTEILNDLSNEEEKNVSPHDLIEDYAVSINILYPEGEKYYFYHRSFQEYFCAVSFSKQMEEELKIIGQFFRARVHEKGDLALPLLNDMIPEKVERFIILPFFQELFQYTAEDHEKNGWSEYWSFLWCMYTKIDCNIGPLCPWHQDSGSCVYMYDFIAEKYGIEQLVGEIEFPYCSQFVDGVFHEEKDENGDMIINFYGKGDSGFVLPDLTVCSELPLDEYGYSMRIDMPELVSYPSQFPEFVDFMEREDFPLKIEYNAMRELCDSLEKKASSPRESSERKIRLRVV